MAVESNSFMVGEVFTSSKLRISLLLIFQGKMAWSVSGVSMDGGPTPEAWVVMATYDTQDHPFNICFFFYLLLYQEFVR